MNRKLSVAEVLEIRQLANGGTLSLRKIAELFGTCHTNVIHIRDRLIWDWVEEKAADKKEN